MCGICGFAYAGNEKDMDKHTLRLMNAALEHRGPDDQGEWFGQNAALAMRRLSILDIEHGHQPMTNEDGSIVVVFNGEIYNFSDIKTQLIKLGHTFKTNCDTEVIVHAYEQYGDDALSYFNGMFAFALYDIKRRRLLLARDRLGIKPLFYTFRNGTLAFASELDSLYRSGTVRPDIDPCALDAFFTFLYIPAPDTIFSDAKRLRPGEKLVFENGSVKTERYWKLEFAPTTTWSLDRAADEYLALLTDSVRLRMISDVPLGAFLSGGIDSSSVTGILSMMNTAQTRTFTIGFDDTDANEMEYARIAAEAFGTDHTEEIMKPDAVELAASLVRHFGEPFADSSAIPTYLVSKLARQSVTVALSGDGGDELFAGYTWLHMNRKVGAYRKLPAPLRQVVNTALKIAPGSPKLAKIQRFSRDSFLPPEQSFRRRQTCFDDELRASLYQEGFAKQVSACAVDRFEEHMSSVAHLSDDDRMLYQDTHMYLPDDILTKVDRMSMANSLEARVPLLDHRIVEFAASVPFSLKLKGNTSKLLVKRAVGDILPPELLKQRKQGFAIPIQRWFREDLRPHFEDTVLGEKSRCAAFIRPEVLRTMMEQHVLNKENYGHHLWTALILEHWLRYIDDVPGMSV